MVPNLAKTIFATIPVLFFISLVLIIAIILKSLDYRILFLRFYLVCHMIYSMLFLLVIRNLVIVRMPTEMYSNMAAPLPA
jgi:hypothetical protein